jgi:hypothetical protein
MNCFIHPKNLPLNRTGSTTFILDEKWTEFNDYIHSIAKKEDTFIIPLKPNVFIKTNKYSWNFPKNYNTHFATLRGLERAVKLRFHSKKSNVFELGLHLDNKIAKAASKLIPIHATHLVVAQNLLPFLYDCGALGGRTFDVLMYRMTIGDLHERLNFAYSQHPDSLTLSDFRAPDALIEMEINALNIAGKIITPHADVAAIFQHKTIKLNWHIPASSNTEKKGQKILFPASALGRKGAFLIKQLAQELNLSLTVSGLATEYEGFWDNIHTETFSGSFEEIGLVIYPTYIEHQPRQILKAISKNIPVITTAACGIEASNNVHIIDTGNYEQLKTEVLKYISIVP